jgi:hypothetical protein
VGAVVAAVVLLVLAIGGGEEPIDPLGPDAPEAFRDLSPDALESRAAAGLSHPLYEKSPSGAVATAERTARWRDQVEEIAADSGSDPDLLEAIVFLESAGRPDAIAGGDLEGAVGLTQILAATATDFLGMQVDLEASRRLTSRLRRAEQRGEDALVRRLSDERRRVDERFDPQKAIEGMGRYLRTARERFGREELAVVSYHMGIGNLENVLRSYAGPEEAEGAEIGDLVEDLDLDYARVFFDSAPDRHGRTWRLLYNLGDDSSTYLWRVLAAERIMRLWRRDLGRLARIAELQTAKPSGEEVLHPQSETEVFDGAAELESAEEAGEIHPLPSDAARYGLEAQGGPAGLRPAALALAAWTGERVRAITRGKSPLTLTRMTEDRGHEEALPRRERHAKGGYSLHTAGFAFDVLREYPDPGQADAFQFALDRLQALNLIAWYRDPEVIHVTVSSEARSFCELSGELCR